jgi:hypothetical protein
VDGDAAASLGGLVRDRWRALRKKTRPRASTPPHDGSRDPWPVDVVPDLLDVDVAIARTMPPFDGEPAIRECDALFVDSIAAAKRCIYIESQYFTNGTLGRALAERLQEPDGPEVIAVIPQECPGWVEQQTMGALRDVALRELAAADRHGRLRVVYPAASRARGVSTFVHSKVMIADDRFVRIGSANFSCRSMGVDTECDVAAEAGGGGSDPRHRAGIRRIRDRLIGEHLGMSGDEVAAEVERLGSLCALIDARKARDDADRALLPVEEKHSEPPSDVLKMVADPDTPIDLAILDELLPQMEAGSNQRAIRWWPRAIVIGSVSVAVGRVVLSPSWSTGLVATAIVFGACVIAFGVRTLLVMRQMSRSVRRDRQRAEFG